jgi:hypothetical protein
VRDIYTRRDALEDGEMYYFTGIPCKHGHLSERAVESSQCAECARIMASGVRLWGRASKAERAETAKRKAERATHAKAMRQIITVTCLCEAGDRQALTDIAISLCLAAYPVLTAADVTPSPIAVRSKFSQYRVMVPAASASRIYEIAAVLRRQRGIDDETRPIARARKS